MPTRSAISTWVRSSTNQMSALIDGDDVLAAVTVASLADACLSSPPSRAL